MQSASHLSLSLGHELWEEMLRQALPVRISAGDFDVALAARGAVRRLALTQRVSGLLEDHKPPDRLMRAGRRLQGAWRRRKASLYRRVDDVAQVEGVWRVELDDAGTDLRYGDRRVAADAFLRATAEGTIRLLGANVEIPFSVSRRVGASVVFADIHFDADRDAVTGTFQELGLHIGDAALIQLVTRLVERLLEPQLAGVNPVPILRREQVESLVGPLGGPLRMHMGVEDMDLEVTEEALTLKVRFGFTQAQLSEDAPR